MVFMTAVPPATQTLVDSRDAVALACRILEDDR